MGIGGVSKGEEMNEKHRRVRDSFDVLASRRLFQAIPLPHRSEPT